MLLPGFKHLRALLVLVLLLASPSAFAQSGRSWMNGIVFGPSETDGLPGATVELMGDTNSERLKSVHLSTLTDEHGKYAFEHVPYGSYHFHVSAPGFRPYDVDIYIASDALTALHVRLKP
jgi:hypothetical protein